VLGLAGASCGGHPAPAGSAPPVNSLTVKACTVDGLAARCGTLIVPEDRLTGTGRTIPVRFVVFPATGPDRAPDPVVYFAGGPGVSAIADIPAWLPDLQSLNVDRDLVFIEQRGTGQSDPLNCPASSAGSVQARLRICAVASAATRVAWSQIAFRSSAVRSGCLPGVARCGVHRCRSLGQLRSPAARSLASRARPAAARAAR